MRKVSSGHEDMKLGGKLGGKTVTANDAQLYMYKCDLFIVQGHGLECLLHYVRFSGLSKLV